MRRAAAPCCSSTRCTASTRPSRTPSCRTSNAASILFVGATTENPSFELNSALLSRCRVHVMEAVSEDDIVASFRRALDDSEYGLGGHGIRVEDARLGLIAHAADGDVRRGLTLLEIAVELAGEAGRSRSTLEQVLADRTRRFDKGGEQFYDQISALHKIVRSPIRMPRCTGSHACSMAGATRCTSRAADPHGGRRHRPGRSARAAMARRHGIPTTALARPKANSRWRS